MLVERLGRVCLLASAALAPSLPGAQSGTEERPSFLVLCLDDVSGEDLAACSTPAIDGIARAGVSIENFYAMPVCSPTRYALQLGRWPRRSGVGTGIKTFVPPSAANPVPPRHLPSLARVLQAAGYRTAMVGKWHLGQVDLGGDLAGHFELPPHLWGYEEWRAGAPENLNNGGGSGYRSWVRVDNGVVLRNENEHATRAQGRAAREWWVATPGPKLLWLNFSAPHAPFQPEDGGGATTARARFLRMIEECDQEIARLLVHVRPRSTYVVLLTDNGTPNNALEPGVDPARAKHSTYERGVNVPCFVSGPRAKAGVLLREPLSCVDLPATLVDLAGLSEPFQDGVSFAEALSNPVGWRNAERPWIFAEYFRTDLPGPADTFLDDQMVRAGRWKMRRVVQRAPLGPVDLFYDLGSDPQEASALSAEVAPAEVVAHLRGLLQALPERGADFAGPLALATR